MTRHHRRSIRLKGYDYTRAGAYFITICTHDRLNIFGVIRQGKMELNEYGKIVTCEWERTAVLRPNIHVADFVIMPNHIHGILVIVDNDDNGTLGRGVLPYAPTTGPYAPTGNETDSRTGVLPYAPTEEFKSPSKTIGAIIRGFKSATTAQINRLRNTPRLPLWQRNYYEHIIRNETSYDRIAEYIRFESRTMGQDQLYVR
ncbi:transposase [bacterium]|nr:transposase [bacterium]